MRAKPSPYRYRYQVSHKYVQGVHGFNSMAEVLAFLAARAESGWVDKERATCEMCLTKYEQDIADRQYAKVHWLERIEQALWLAHKDALERLGLDSWEEVHYYDGLAFVISYRTNNDGY